MSVIYLLRCKLQTLPRARCGCIYSTAWSLNLRWRTLDTQSCSGTVPPRRHQLPDEGPPRGHGCPPALAWLLPPPTFGVDPWKPWLRPAGFGEVRSIRQCWWKAECENMNSPHVSVFLYLFDFQNKKYFWSTVDLQYCVDFRCTKEWIRKKWKLSMLNFSDSFSK